MLPQGRRTLKPGGEIFVGFAPVLSAKGMVNCLAIQPDGRLVIGGTFTSVNGMSRHNVARLNPNGSFDSSFDPSLGPNRMVRSIALQPDGKLLIGSEFLNLNGVMRRHSARLYGDAAPPPLCIVRPNAMLVISWPSPSTSVELQESTDLAM